MKKMLKRIIAIVMTFALLAGGLAFASIEAMAKSGFDPTDAKSIKIGDTVKDTRYPNVKSGESQWYKFEVSASGIYTVAGSVNSNTSTYGVSMELFDETGKQVGSGQLPVNKNASFSTVLIKGTYYVNIYSGIVWYYDSYFSFKISRVDADSAYQSFEESCSTNETKTRNDSEAKASKIGNGTYHGVIAADKWLGRNALGNNNVDYYAFSTEKGAKVTVSRKEYKDSYANITVYNDKYSSGKELNSSSEEKSVTVEAGNYYIKVEGDDVSEQLGSYTITLSGAEAPAENHEHTLTPIKAKDASCTEAGNTEYWYCEGCEKCFADENATEEVSKSSVTIKALGHDWGEWTVTKKATYTSPGEKTRVCKRDASHVQTQTIAKKKYVTAITTGVNYAVTVGIGTSQKISYTIKPSDAINKGVTFTSWDENIAKVDSKGVVTGVTVGNVWITVKAKDGSGVETYVPVAVAQPEIAYRSYVQKVGWQAFVGRGASSGTKGLGLRIEGLQVKLLNYSGGVKYRAYVQKEGWQSYRENGQTAGTLGEAKRIEAIQVKLTGEAAKILSVCYRVYVQKFGWLGWTGNGQTAGTSGYGYRIENVQMKLVAGGGIAFNSSYGKNPAYRTAKGK